MLETKEEEEDARNQGSKLQPDSNHSRKDASTPAKKHTWCTAFGESLLQSLIQNDFSRCIQNRGRCKQNRGRCRQNKGRCKQNRGRCKQNKGRCQQNKGRCQQIKADVKKIKADVKKIKADVNKIKADVNKIKVSDCHSVPVLLCV